MSDEEGDEGMIVRKTIGAMLAAAAGVLLSVSASHADVSKLDAQIIARALGFLENPVTGDATVGIVHAGDAGKTEADQLAGVLGGGLKAGKVTLIPKIVDVSELSTLSGAPVVFVPAGMAAQFDAIAGYVSSNKAISVTLDEACVDAGKCVMAVKSKPKVEIIVSQAASAASGAAFKAAFKMMITER